MQDAFAFLVSLGPMRGTSKRSFTRKVTVHVDKIPASRQAHRTTRQHKLSTTDVKPPLNPSYPFGSFGLREISDDYSAKKTVLVIQDDLQIVAFC